MRISLCKLFFGLIQTVSTVILMSSTWYTRVAKMPQNGCDRDRSLAWICIRMLKCPISFPLWIEAFWHRWQERDQKWGILASVCISMQVNYLCHSHFGAFWQPSRMIFEKIGMQFVKSCTFICIKILTKFFSIWLIILPKKSNKKTNNEYAIKNCYQRMFRKVFPVRISRFQDNFQEIWM